MKKYLTVTLTEYLNENKRIVSKEKLIGKKFYHGTTLETWKQNDSDCYLFIVEDFEFAKNSAIDRTYSMVQEYNKSFTAIVVEIIISDDIIKLEWFEDDDNGNYRTFNSWYDSYNDIGSFIIYGKYDINNFKIVHKENII